MVSDMPSHFPTIGECNEPFRVSPPSLPSCWTSSSKATIGISHAPLFPAYLRCVPTKIPDSAPMSALDYELVPLRTPEGLILYFKHLTSLWVFRIIPSRDPDQPRLWCLRMEPCAGASLSAKTARIDPFYTSLAMTREQLNETLEKIRHSIPTWLGGQPQVELRQWLERITRMPTPIEFTPPDRPVRGTRPTPDQPQTQPVRALAAPLRDPH